MKEICVYDNKGNTLTELVQWDEDVIVCVEEQEITQPYAVHFFNSDSNEAYVVNSTYERGVLKAKIPHALLARPYPIIGYVYITDTGGNRSIYRFRLNMRKKPQPSNFVYKGTKDYVNIEEVLEECKELAETSESFAKASKSYAVGETGTRSGENTDNSKYYYQQSKSYANTASVKASEAAASAAASKISENNAKNSETNSKVSETNAERSKTAAANSSASAADSASAAAGSAAAAANSANTASAKATEAANSAALAKTSETNAKASETNAANSKTAAKNSAAAAKESENNSAVSKNTASTKATEAANSAAQSKSYAVGGTGTRTNENIDNSKYYYEQSKVLAESLSGALRPMGTVAFANLPGIASVSEGDMYNISNQFTTTSDFKEGTGNVIPAGANIYKTADGKWDVLAGTPVTGIKGNAETSYRRGNVNITLDNIGAAAKNHAHSAATTSAAGLMSAADKTKLDSIVTGANKYTLPAATSTIRGGVKIGYTANGKNYPVQLSNEQMYVNVPWTDNNTTYSNMTAATASAAGRAGLVPAPAAGAQAKYLRGDGTWQTPPDTNTTYSAATQSAAGLMSAADKKKLDSGYLVKSDSKGLYVEY